MRNGKILPAVSMLLSFAFITVPRLRGESDAAKTPPAVEKASPYRSVTFSVPDLTKETGRKISEAIAQSPGLVSARPDLEKKTFTVLFVSEKTSGADIHKALLTVASGAKIDREEAVSEKDAKVNCSGCPNRKSCPSEAARKAEAKPD